MSKLPSKKSKIHFINFIAIYESDYISKHLKSDITKDKQLLLISLSHDNVYGWSHGLRSILNVLKPWLEHRIEPPWFNSNEIFRKHFPGDILKPM